MRGGAQVRSGPPPDPNALHRSKDGHEWWTLPQSGPDGPPPEWPLPDVSSRERELWDKLWTMPQAVAWSAMRCHDEVALYCRRFAIAEDPDATVNEVTLLRQLGDNLGLTIPGLNRNRWKIGRVEQPPTEKPARRPSARDRLKVVDGGPA